MKEKQVKTPALRRKRFWRRLRSLILVITAMLVFASAAVFVGTRWPQRLPFYISEVNPLLPFERVADPGFDEEGRERLADSAWSMRYFQPEGADSGYVYVGTDNNILGRAFAVLRSARRGGDLPVEPPQVRRYRPDLGPMVWEVVLDLAEEEDATSLDQGFRTMAVYEPPGEDHAYLYTGTMAERNPSVWRSISGEPGSWERVFVFPYDSESQIGSIRGMVVHEDGLLYMSTTSSGDILEGGIGQIWATDGTDFTQVVMEGFGIPENTGITNLASFNGCLYAGTYNPENGFEVWKLRCLEQPDAPPQAVIVEGAGRRYNETAMNLFPFKDHLYVGTGIPLGFNPTTRRGPRGCSLLRIDKQDQYEVVVGPRRQNPLSQYRPGYGWYMNAYCWYMEEHNGYLYLGTWDLSRTIVYLGNQAERVAPRFRRLLNYLVADPGDWRSPVGGDLYRSQDGVHWEPVFLDGFDNPDNHGIRTLESTPMGLFVGTENPFTRLEVWRLLDYEGIALD